MVKITSLLSKNKINLAIHKYFLMILYILYLYCTSYFHKIRTFWLWICPYESQSNKSLFKSQSVHKQSYSLKNKVMYSCHTSSSDYYDRLLTAVTAEFTRWPISSQISLASSKESESISIQIQQNFIQLKTVKISRRVHLYEEKKGSYHVDTLFPSSYKHCY